VGSGQWADPRHVAAKFADQHRILQLEQLSVGAVEAFAQWVEQVQAAVNPILVAVDIAE
jgi:hypothetical protein